MGKKLNIEEEIMRKIQKGEQYIFKVVKKENESDINQFVLKEINKSNLQNIITPSIILIQTNRLKIFKKHLIFFMSL